MARVTYVKKARGTKRGENRRCTGCGKAIKPGDPYKWFANRIGRMSSRKDYCASCVIRPSMMTTSPHLATIYAAQEAAEDALAKLDRGEGLDSITQVLRDCAEGYREAKESYEESANNIVEGFGHETQQSEEIMEKSQACESAADELDNNADEIEGLDDPAAEDSEFEDDFETDAGWEYDGERDEDTDEPLDADAYKADREAALHDFAEEKRDERWDEAISQASDYISEGVQV
jgi:hypothetical protein